MKVLLFVFLLVNASQALSGKLPSQHIPVEDFSALARFSMPQLSPNGRYLAAKMSNGERSYIVIRDLHDQGSKLTRLSDGEYYINWFEWANDERLLLSVRKSRKIRDRVIILSTIGSIKKDGSEPIFYKAKANRKGFFKRNPSLVSLIKDDPEHVLLALDNSPNHWASPVVHKVNLETGVRERVQDNPNLISSWLASDRKGDISVALRYERGANGRMAEMLLKNASNGQWEVFESKEYFDVERMEPVRMKPNSEHILLVNNDKVDGFNIHYREPKLREFDLRNRQIGNEYVDVDYEKIKDDISFLLPDENIQIASRDDGSRFLVLKAERSDKPTRYFLYEVAKGKLDYLASESPKLDDVLLSKKKPVQYTARDGYSLPAYLSLPKSQLTNKAAVVLVHGGPHSRDYANYDAMVQMLNNRGYAVIQPQFRGSSGFSVRHRQAGMKQWGRLMQDDVTDAANWLIEQGFANKDRICIVGASYGGYAAAMGLAKEPDLFRCGVSINGVLDFPLLRRDVRDRSLYKSIQRKGLNDISEAKDVSPVHQVKRIKSPLLLFHVKGDAVADIEHSRRMNKAMLKHKKPVEYIELDGGEHWRTDNQQEKQKFLAVDRFLAKHLAVEN